MFHDSESYHDKLNAVRARARLLELALAGSRSTGFCIDEGIYNDALTQAAGDIAREIDLITDSEKYYRRNAGDRAA